MKTYCRGLAVDRAVVERAYEEWLSHEAGRKNRRRVEREHGSASALVDEILREIRGRSLSFRPLRHRERIEPTNGKVRPLAIASVKQQVCDYILITCLDGMVRARLGFWQVAGVRGKGSAFGVRAVRRWVRSGERYFVKSDISKCYPSMSTDMVMAYLRKRVGSDDLLYVAGAILGTYGGSLQMGSALSQRLSQLVLSEAYHMIEGLHRVRRGRRKALVSRQIWQADDFVLFSGSKRDLKAAIRAVASFLRGLGMSIKPWKVCRVGEREPCDLCGAASTPASTRLRGRTFVVAMRAFSRYRRRRTLALARRCVSYYGCFLRVDAEGVRRRRGIDRLACDAKRLISFADRRNHGSGVLLAGTSG